MVKSRTLSTALIAAMLLTNTGVVNATTIENTGVVNEATVENTSESTTQIETTQEQTTESTTEASTEIKTEETTEAKTETTTEAQTSTENDKKVIKESKDFLKKNLKKEKKKKVKKLKEEDEEIDAEAEIERKKKYLKEASADSKYYVTWKQCSPIWGESIVKNSGNTMARGACSTTSQSIIIKMAGYAKGDDFTPLTYMRWAEKTNQQFIQSMLCTSAVSNYTNGKLSMIKTVRDNKYNSEEEIYKLAKWGYENGYYMIMHISHAKGGGHFVPVIGFDTKAEKIYVNQVGRNDLTGFLDYAGYYGSGNPGEIMDGIDFYKCETSTFKDFCEKGDEYIQSEMKKLRESEEEAETKEKADKKKSKEEAEKKRIANEQELAKENIEKENARRAILFQNDTMIDSMLNRNVVIYYEE